MEMILMMWYRFLFSMSSRVTSSVIATSYFYRRITIAFLYSIFLIIFLVDSGE